MNSESTDEYFSWLPVVNTVEYRLKDDSLLHNFSSRNKIRESTKKLNKYLKTNRLKQYSEFKECKKTILSKIIDNGDVSDDSDLSDSDYKTFYSSFYDTSTGNSTGVHDDLFVWSFVEKKGLKIVEPTGNLSNSIWEPAININVADNHSQDKVTFNGSFKAAEALPIIDKFYEKKSIKGIQYNTTNSSSNKSINKSTNFIDARKETSEKKVEKINNHDTEKLRNKKSKDVKRNLNSAINYLSLQVSETSKVDYTCDFAPEDFQAQSTHIFSDSFTDNNVPVSNTTKQAHKFSSNHTNNQPRDSGIEEDSRDENTTHQNNENDRSLIGQSKNKKQGNLSSEIIDTYNELKKKSLKIIGSETLKKKYKIVDKNDRTLQPIMEVKHVPSSNFNDKNKSYSKYKLNHDFESDFESIESDDNEKEPSNGEKSNESSDEYVLDHDDCNTLSLKNKKSSRPKGRVVKNQSTETDTWSDFQDSKHRNQRLKNEFIKHTSPWAIKQYNDLKRLRLIDSSQEESEIDLNNQDTSGITTEQEVLTESKKTFKKLTNNIEKINENKVKSKKEKLFINNKQIRNSDLEMPNISITDANIKKHSARKDECSSNKMKKFIANGNDPNSKLNSDNRKFSEFNTTYSYKSLKRSKKFRKRKGEQSNNTSELLSSREQSYERHSQYDVTNISKSCKDVHSSKSIKDDDSKENIHQSFEKYDTISNSAVGISTKQKIKSDDTNPENNSLKENVDAIYSENDNFHRDSSALSIKDLLTSKEGKENNLKNQVFSASNDDKESEDEKTMSEHQKKHLQQFKKMDLMVSGESSASEGERKNVDFRNKNESSSNGNERTREKSKEISYESNDNEIDIWKTENAILPQKESRSDDSNKEDEAFPTEHTREKIQQMKRLNFDNSSESEESENETISVNKRKSKFVKEQYSNENSKRARGASDGEESEEEGVKSEDSSDENKSSDVAHRRKKIKLHREGNDADLNKYEDNESVHYDSDNIDVKEHKIGKPKDLKDSNLFDQLNESDFESSNVPLGYNKFETPFGRKNKTELENDSDEEIDNIVPVEVSKRMQQLKRLNLYEDNESSDSDELLKNKRTDRHISQKPFNILRKECDESSCDEKESINEEPPISSGKLDESVLNDMKEDIEDKVEDEKELEKGNREKSNNVIIPETQETEDSVLDNTQSQEMFSSLENLAECSSPIPPTPQPVSKKHTPSQPARGNITEIAELVQQEELTETFLEPTISLGDISDDEDVFVIEVPKNVFHENVIDKKLVLKNNTLTIGESHYEAFEKGSLSISCVMKKSKKKKFKIVNIRPLVTIIARRKKNEDDYNENIGIKNKNTMKNQRFAKKSHQDYMNKFCDTASTSTQKSKLKKQKLPKKDKLHALSSTTLKEGTITKKKVGKNKKFDFNNFVDDVESLREKAGQHKKKTNKVSKIKLYASDHEVKDVVDSNAIDESCINNSSRNSKNKKNVTGTVKTNAKSVKRVTKDEIKLQNPSAENELVSDLVESKSKTNNKKKAKIKTEVPHRESPEERTLENVISQKIDEEMFDRMFHESFIHDISCVEEVKPVKKKAKKRKITSETKQDVNSETTVKMRKKSPTEEVVEGPADTVKSKKSKKKVDKRKEEEPASIQIMKLINNALNFNNEKLNTSTSSNESRYEALDIERVPVKKNYLFASSSDESEKKDLKPIFRIRDKSKEKELPKPSSSKKIPIKKEVKDEKKKVKKVYFDE